MKKVHTRVVTAKPAEEVYAYLVDFTNQADWRFDVLTSELVSGDVGVVGAKYSQLVRVGRDEQQSEVELVEAKSPDEVAFRTLDTGMITVSGAWHLRPAGEGTEVICDVAIETRGPLRLIEPMMGPQLRKIARKYEIALSEKLNP
ncbi:SRPBCC family protein [Amycolatopsis sp.]|jgi:carbon monoxide dehydrogenase subunit G|uniref:SRPBCC family protein n=1 Tax=Amycolatopsis sp. TaxID=37632 RepID=UPI002DFB8C3A|nr:SRPBCC family protein [Amycolatopsis sp.]